MPINFRWPVVFQVHFFFIGAIQIQINRSSPFSMRMSVRFRRWWILLNMFAIYVRPKSRYHCVDRSICCVTCYALYSIAKIQNHYVRRVTKYKSNILSIRHMSHTVHHFINSLQNSFYFLFLVIHIYLVKCSVWSCKYTIQNTRILHAMNEWNTETQTNATSVSRMFI